MEDKKGKITSPIKKKALLLLAGGLALGLARNPRSQKYIFKTLKKDWKEINRKYLYKIVREFKDDRLIDYKEKGNGVVEIILTAKGHEMILNFNIDKIEIRKPLKWDKKWRIVFFDIPEKRRAERNVLRDKLKELGFEELQKSVFIHPYPCLDEINFITEYFQLRNLVRYGEMINISNEEEFKLKFKLY
ncbi:MAG: CRISPR-associated endonuclease Cas2 [Candidatus Moranbacteria bacterium]|nr:CRISPR-associated endonuclease Cas2 [Candidatus Moranbacteria bacterium]